ncbi:DUF6731 family protein [Anabaena sp. UHCC 0399]|uniref:DUF6731 family protein n=1 Tax=Anabaena sp. UHCC 0399 TaxID=3110238 RepID=UPI002B1FD1FE|nr:DUF6731 family protein [Anabaena sp. UHCC 0399]MEA5567516.1 DUF6731 family protein [Anabaena sp. UHCC 0399]
MKTIYLDAMSKTLNVDFFKVVIPADMNLSFGEVLQKVIQLPADQRFQEVRLHYVSLHEAVFGWQQTWEGEIVRLRMDNIPVKANLAGKIEDFKLADDEGIGEQSAFIYDPATNILLLQSNKHGVSPGNFARYFELIISSNASIYIDPVIQLDALQRLEQMKTVKKLNISIAALENMSVFENSGLEEFVNLTTAYQAPAIDIEFKVSRSKKSSLPLEKVRNATTALLCISNQNQSQVKKIRISGSSDDDDNLYVDLLKDKMRESIQIKASTGQRNIPYLERQKALRDAWEKRKSEIFKMYGKIT